MLHCLLQQDLQLVYLLHTEQKKILTTGALFSFIYNNYSIPTHSCKTLILQKQIRTLKRCFKLCQLFWKKVGQKTLPLADRTNSKFLTDGVLFSFNHSNYLTPVHSCKTLVLHKVLCLLSFKKVSFEKMFNILLFTYVIV